MVYFSAIIIIVNGYTKIVINTANQTYKSMYVCIGCVTVSRLNAKIVHEMKDDGGGGTVDDLQL